MRTSLHTADGYLLGLAFPRRKAAIPPNSNATSELVFKLITDTLPAGSKVAADNLFNYVELLKRLYEAGYHMFGTARPNHVPVTSAIKTKWESLCVHLPDSPVYVFGWWDSKICLFMSNLPDTDEAIVKRWHKAPAAEGGTQRKDVPAPRVGKRFNDTKSGADLNDLMMIQYASRRPSPKWTKAWVAWVFDQARVLAYQIAKKKVPKFACKTHLQFTLELAKSLISQGAQAADLAKRKGTASLTPSPSAKRMKVSLSPTKRFHIPTTMDLRGIPEDSNLFSLVKRNKKGFIVQHKCALCAIRFKEQEGAAPRVALGPRHETYTFCAFPTCMKFLCMDRGCHALFHEKPHLYDLAS